MGEKSGRREKLYENNLMCDKKKQANARKKRKKDEERLKINRETRYNDDKDDGRKKLRVCIAEYQNIYTYSFFAFSL